MLDCGQEALQVFNSLIKTSKKSINELRMEFIVYQKEQYKISKDLLSIVTAYNILNR